ncbi:alpha/beta fold hydrolase [Lentzea flava]|uniref:3-oxoadipate enol-lactonase n=1 Tax=Lentzea flava TaxID=103732 RepID=A0ABQ2UM18_9PSEU|nr:alpha/beta fold hydrolase [Lentzea flava]MCP2200353.1 3-oxoadipate enol-lactonase [Lentzea flava]GGU41704.1 3-oxoadipate enol-lactonase [Lentzea flava]
MIPHHTLTGPADAPVLVLANALGTTTELWRDFALPFRLLRFDHRGHGASAPTQGPCTIETLAADVVDLLDHLELRQVYYCGVSLGGMIGMWLAAHTDRISRLALLCTTAWHPDKSGWDERVETARTLGLEPLADTIVARWFTPSFSPAVVAHFRSELLKVDVPSYIACAEAIRDMDLRPDLAKIDVPTVVIAAAQDHATPPECARAIADELPDSELYIVGDAAHLAVVEAPRTISVILDDHFGND